MSGCDAISDYLDGRLDSQSAERFEEHLAACAGCRDAVESWREIAARIVDVTAVDSGAVDPTTIEALGLVQRAELERSRPRLGRARIAFAATVLLALGLGVGYWLARPAPAGTEAPPTAPPEGGRLYRTDAHSRTVVRLGEDELRLGPQTAVRVIDSGSRTRLELEEGALACQVGARAAGGGFVVEASGLTVRVTGTRFLVALEEAEQGPAQVLVAEGSVDVRSAVAGEHRLEAGEQLELVAAAEVRRAPDAELARIDRLFEGPAVAGSGSAPAPVEPSKDPGTTAAPASPPSAGDGPPAPAPETGAPEEISALERWRGWVIEGRLDEARFALRSHLDAHPADVEAWSLLADCERKRASWAEAVAAYDELARRATGASANRARYKAARILQDRLGDHRRAIALLERYVAAGDGGSVLVAKARVRLARSLIELGQGARARGLLEQVIEGASDAQTIGTAEQLLERTEQK